MRMTSHFPDMSKGALARVIDRTGKAGCMEKTDGLMNDTADNIVGCGRLKQAMKLKTKPVINDNANARKKSQK